MKHRTLLCIALTLTGLANAGSPVKNPKNPVAPVPEENPLSFYGGKLVFDFQEKMRFEIRENNFDFNDSLNSVTDDSWLLQRARLGMKIKPVDWFTFYIQGQSSFEIDSDRPNEPGVLGAEGDDPIDISQAYIQLGTKAMNLTLGRQIFLYGDERLLGPLDWTNLGRTFDAARFHYEGGDWWVDIFAASVVTFDPDRLNGSDFFNNQGVGRDQVLSGIYFSSTGLIDWQVTDLYALHLHESSIAGDTNFMTLGTRMKADPKKLGGWDYDTEMAVQFGEVRDKDLAAFAGHWGIGYNWLKHPWKPRLGIEYNFATGDSDATDGDVNTFQNLFPTNHKFYGYMDVFAWQNIHNPAVSFSVQPTAKLKAQIDYHLFWLVDTGDAWYRANGVTAVRPITPGADNFAGSELDVTLTYKVNKNLSLQAGYSHFFAGDYLSDAGSKASDDADFAYMQVQIDF
jgi:hypothetical protein